MKNLFALGLALMQSGVLAQEPGLRGVAVSPVMFRTVARPGSTVNLSIQIENLDPTPLEARLKVRSVVYQPWSYIPDLDTKHDQRLLRLDCGS